MPGLLRSTAAVALLFAAVAILAPAAATAGTVLITPDQLTPETGAAATNRTPGYLKGTGQYYKVVKLPAGKLVKRLLITYTAGGAGFSFHAKLIRKKPGQFIEPIIDPTGDFSFGGVLLPETVATTPADVKGPARVARGYK